MHMCTLAAESPRCLIRRSSTSSETTAIIYICMYMYIYMYICTSAAESPRCLIRKSSSSSETTPIVRPAASAAVTMQSTERPRLICEGWSSAGFYFLNEVCLVVVDRHRTPRAPTTRATEPCEAMVGWGHVGGGAASRARRSGLQLWAVSVAPSRLCREMWQRPTPPRRARRAACIAWRQRLAARGHRARRRSSQTTATSNSSIRHRKGHCESFTTSQQPATEMTQILRALAVAACLAPASALLCGAPHAACSRLSSGAPRAAAFARARSVLMAGEDDMMAELRERIASVESGGATQEAGSAPPPLGPDDVGALSMGPKDVVDYVMRSLRFSGEGGAKALLGFAVSGSAMGAPEDTLGQVFDMFIHLYLYTCTYMCVCQGPARISRLGQRQRNPGRHPRPGI